MGDLKLYFLGIVIILVGIESMPFSLNDVALAAYIVTGLGIPVGLANRAIRGAIASFFGIKS